MNHLIGILLHPGFDLNAYVGVLQAISALNQAPGGVQCNTDTLSTQHPSVSSSSRVSIATRHIKTLDHRLDIIVSVYDVNTEQTHWAVDENSSNQDPPDTWNINHSKNASKHLFPTIEADILSAYKEPIGNTGYQLSRFGVRIYFPEPSPVQNNVDHAESDKHSIFRSIATWLIHQNEQTHSEMAKNLTGKVAGDSDMDNSHQIKPASIGKRTAMRNSKLQEALELMQFNLTEPLSTAEISEHTNITPRQLERLFKQNFDMPPSRYYMKLRLEAVRQAIRTSQNTVSELAEQFGFSSGSHLSSRYKGYFEVSPSKDRMQ